MRPSVDWTISADGTTLVCTVEWQDRRHPGSSAEFRTTLPIVLGEGPEETRVRILKAARRIAHAFDKRVEAGDAIGS